MVFRKIVKKIQDWFTTGVDRTKFAMVGVGCLFKKPKYVAVFIVSLLVMLYILSFFRDGAGNWQLLFSGLPFVRKLEMLGMVFLNIWQNFTSLYGLLIILMSILQALVIMLLVFAWRHREKDATIDGASTGSIGAVLGFVALGCPTCGIGLLMPLLTAIAGAGAMALAEGFSQVFTVLAFILLFYTVIKLGYICFITISASKYKEKKTCKKRLE